MNLSEVNQELQRDKSTKKKPVKPDYSQFLDDLKILLDNKEIKNSINAVFKHLKKGFQEQVKHQHIEDVTSNLANCDYYHLLALKIVISSYFSRSPALLKKLARELKERIAKQIDFPPDAQIHTNYADTDRKQILESWVQRNIKDGVLGYNWARKAITCLINEDIPVNDLEIIQHIIEKCSKPKQQKKQKDAGQSRSSEQNYKEYANQLTKLFLAKEAPKGKIANIVTQFKFTKNINKDLIYEKNELSDRCNNLEYKLNELKSRFEDTKQNLEHTEMKKKQLENNLSKTEQDLIKEKERYQSLEEYWKKESAHLLTKQKLSFIKDFEHVISEARLSLEGENPNIAMALRRIKQMEEYLERYGDRS